MRKLSELHKKLNNIEWFEPVFTISMSLIVTFVIIVAVKSMFSEQDISIASNKAEEYFYEGKYDDAISEYTELQKSDEWPIWRVKLAEVYAIKGDYEKSDMLLREAIIIRNRLIEKNKEKYLEKDKEFMNEVVFNFFMNNEIEQALSLGEDYILNNDKYKPLMRTMFAVYMAAGETENANDIVNEYEVDKDSAYDMALLASMQMMTEDIEDGLYTLKMAYELDNNEIKVFDVIRDLTYYNNEELLTKLIELSETTNDEAYNMFLAKAYLIDSEDYSSSENILKLLGESSKESINYKLMESEILRSKGKVEEANSIIDSIINSKERSYSIDYISAMELYNEGKYDKALEYCKKSILENDDYPDNYENLIPNILLEKNDVSSIDSYFRTALLREPFNLKMIVKIGDYYAYKLEDYDIASDYYNLALRINQDDAELYYTVGNMEISKGEYEKAAEYLEKAISLDDNNNKYYRALGIIYLKLGENEKAIESTRYAYYLNEEDVLALSNVGCYYLSVEGDIWRGFSNIEAAYEEMSDNLDEESKNMIIENYTKAKKLFDSYIEEEETEFIVPDFHLFY